MNKYSENDLVEQPTKELFAELGYEVMDCFDEVVGENGTLGRETYRDVVLVRKLREALIRLNPSLPPESIETAVAELIKDRSALHPTLANKEVYTLLKDGVATSIRASDGSIRGETVRVIDWNTTENNDFFLASQFWVAGDFGRKRPDLIGFLNGIPLVFIELKAAHVSVKDGYDKNLSDYKDTIPHLFWYNALTILSNGTESRIGTISAAWEYFVEWPKINSEGEARKVSLETMVRGTCEKDRLLDLVENFILFTDSSGSPTKILAKNHQFLGVTNAINALQELNDENRSRLGVFWHTQGSGKSYSMGGDMPGSGRFQCLLPGTTRRVSSFTNSFEIAMTKPSNTAEDSVAHVNMTLLNCTAGTSSLQEVYDVCSGGKPGSVFSAPNLKPVSMLTLDDHPDKIFALVQCTYEGPCLKNSDDPLACDDPTYPACQRGINTASATTFSISS